MQPITNELIKEMKKCIGEETKRNVGDLLMINDTKIYSERATEIIRDIEKVRKKKMEICELLKMYQDTLLRNFIQKYAETEMNNYSSKMGKFSMVLALIALVISAIALAVEPQSQWNPILIKIDFIILILLFVWLFYIIFEKNQLKSIIIKIEDDRLNKQNGEVKSIIPETEVSEKDLKIKVEKFDLNLSISAGK